MRAITLGSLLFIAGAALLAAPSSALPARAGRPVRVARHATEPARSLGAPNDGHLEGGQHLEPSVSLEVLPGHPNRWGLPELVGMLHRSADRVNSKYPGSVLSVGDLSRRGGGDVSGHHSHESGRDADVGFFVRTESGKPAHPGRLVVFDESGRAPGRLVFDDARNWALVEAWLTDPAARVSRIFVAAALRDRLLAYARRAGVSSRLRGRAAQALTQPSGALPHDNHFHVRIGCPSAQRGTCIEYVSREHGDAAGRRRVARARPVLARGRRRAGTATAARPLVAEVPAPNDFDDARADAREVVELEDEGGEPRVAR